MLSSKRLDIVRRSKLLLPASALVRTPLHHLRGNADALIVDLRDALDTRPLMEEVASRLRAVAGLGVDLFVCIPYDGLSRALDRLGGVRLDGIALSARSPSAVQEADRVLSAYDVPGTPPLQIDLFLDTPGALLNLYETATASARVVSLTVDETALAHALGITPSADIDQFFYPRGLALLVARLADVQAHGLAFVPPHADGSPPSLEERAVVARKMGLTGALCSTPEEAVILNRAFTPPVEEVQWCRKALWVLEDALRHGLGSATLDGKEMVDIAMLKHIRTLLARESAICRKDAQKAWALGE
ncbi:MAG: hypothetical protein NZ951_01770 [Dehalococcoidia bacterium]|nr:hypothetical protein [Dehalococcoidia bacterium]MDW8119556.1 hypothetical protein [Chloroflexota bacterium]